MELSINSPSDYDHVFRPFCLQGNYPYIDKISDPENFEPLRQRLIEENALHDPHHGWVHGSHMIPNPDCRQRLLGAKPLEFDFSGVRSRRNFAKSTRVLPGAKIVRAFLVRRASFRGFSAKVLFTLFESFSSIEEVRIEKWLEVYSNEQLVYEEGM